MAEVSFKPFNNYEGILSNVLSEVKAKIILKYYFFSILVLNIRVCVKEILYKTVTEDTHKKGFFKWSDH